MYRSVKKKTTENPQEHGPGSEEVIKNHVSLDEIQGNFAPKEVIEKSNFTIAIVSNTLTNTSALTMSTIKINNDVVPNHLDQTDEDGDTHLWHSAIAKRAS